MKKILFVLPLMAMMVVGCSNPTNPVIIPPVVPTTEPETPVTPAQPETPSQPETPATTEPEQPAEPQTPTVPEDKSPYEYVKPDCVNLADYTYVGDYIFADSMNFAEWKYSNSETDYLLAFEKIARVKNDNPDTRLQRWNHNETNAANIADTTKATKYKIYVKTTWVESKNINENLIDTFNTGMSGTYDGTQIRIRKTTDTTFSIVGDNISDYVAY